MKIIESEIKLIMLEYIEKVDMFCNELIKSLGLKNKREFFNYKIKQNQNEFKVNDFIYKLHGKGCFVFIGEQIIIDWDFGYRSRWCGIDPWKLAMTLERSNDNHNEYYDGNKIKEICEQAVASGEMFKKSTQYYFTIPNSETFKPKFPKEFDSIEIESNENKCIIPRNKLVDRFIRKSYRIYKEIEKYNNFFILKFLLNNNEIYSILYNDIGYPESAVKIMDEILKECDFISLDIF